MNKIAFVVVSSSCHTLARSENAARAQEMLTILRASDLQWKAADGWFDKRAEDSFVITYTEEKVGGETFLDWVRRILHGFSQDSALVVFQDNSAVLMREGDRLPVTLKGKWQELSPYLRVRSGINWTRIEGKYYAVK